VSGNAAETPETIRARLGAWRRTGDIDALWPDVPRAARQRALAAIRRAAQAILRGEPPLTIEAASAAAADALGVAAFTAGMGPLLGWWAKHGQLYASGGAREVLAEHLDHGERRSRLLRSEAARIVGAMQHAGLRPILLKGLHTGAEFFPHPSTRPAADIDLLIHPSERSLAASVLRDLGMSERRTRFAARSEWTPASSTSVVRSLRLDHAENPWSLDLHDALGRWYFRGTRRSLGTAAFATERTIELEGVRARVLAQPFLAAFLALHAGYDLGKMQLGRIVELVMVLRQDTGAGLLDPADLARLLASTDTGRFAYPGLALAEELSPGCVGAEVLAVAGRGVGPRLRRVLAAVRAAEWGPLPERSLDLKLAWAVGPLETLLNLTEIVLPSDDGMGGLREVYAQRLRLLGRRLSGRNAPAGVSR
jgi:hypothetical protein